MEIIGLVVVVAILGGIIAIGVVLSKKAKKKRSTCQSCGKQYDYDEDVEWSVISTTTSDKRREANVKITCTCPNCGTVKTFTKTYTVAYVNPSNGNVNEHNLHDLVRKSFL